MCRVVGAHPFPFRIFFALSVLNIFLLHTIASDTRCEPFVKLQHVDIVDIVDIVCYCTFVCIDNGDIEAGQSAAWFSVTPDT